ncbi:uncharacterized protein N7496_007440 [Penicillium cataractarum]|uniref:Uncharacterized protein n=1 Tax=Penicillium cataractarum TaxID=2100454 RepID=A0A9W9V730_9EURO|nr:uncharacterized protein N7496_007440 [Penicillium cataractarum]KAJ5371348.1 hypothetical protein N7496_007440 [Penicillium cataractarum]
MYFVQPVDYIQNSRMESSPLAQLGYFAKLPTEIRLLLWEALFRLIPPKSDHAIEHSPNTLSILCCSRCLHNEIVYHFYRDVRCVFLICPREPDKLGIRLQLESRWTIVERDLYDIQTVRNVLEHFPRPEMRGNKIYVDIQSSYSNDPGRIILLSERVNKLVQVLKELSYIPSVHVELIGRWHHQNGKARESIHNFEEYRPDYDIVLLPFTRLSDWDYYLPDDLSTVISNETKLSNEPIARRSMVSLLREHAIKLNGNQDCLNTEFDLLDSNWLFEQWLTDTRIFLDTRLDTLPGETARLLRRRRFANWFEDGDTWKSQYEEKFLTDISSNLRILLKHDPRLGQARLRHRYAVFTHHQICAAQDELSSRELPICQPWNSRLWATTRPKGLKAISCAEIMTPEAMIVYDIYTFVNKDIAQFSRDLHWWGVDSKDIFEKRKPWWFSCVGCQELGRPCRWCEEYDVDKACRLCREGGFDKTGHVVLGKFNRQ